MTVDRTLHIRSGGAMKRNVLSRAERIAILREAGELDEQLANPLGLRKTKVRVSKAGTKTKKEEKPEAAVAVEGAVAEGAAKAEAKPAAGKPEAKGGKAEAKGKGGKG